MARDDPELRIMVAYLRANPDVVRQLARFRAAPEADAGAVGEAVLWQAAFRRFRWWWEQENPGDRGGGA